MLGRLQPPINADLSSRAMPSSPPDLAQVRLDNALLLFEEFVRATARHADAATLRGLEKRFAERVQIQPSYWSQIKSRSRQIGERLARQFEHLCHKPRGWMDVPHDANGAASGGAAAGGAGPSSGFGALAATGAPRSAEAADDSGPRDDDERFIVGLVLTYYRRHPQRARTRLLDLLGEVLTPTTTAPAGAAGATAPPKPSAASAPPPGARAPMAEDPHSLWLRSQTGVAPLKKRR